MYSWACEKAQSEDKLYSFCERKCQVAITTVPSKKNTSKEEKTNTRNGYTHKTLKSEQGPVEIVVPRDREGSYDPLLVKKHQTSLTGFNEKILWMYARGMSTRDIQAQLREWYGVEVSPQLISNVTEAVMDEVRQWQNRPLEEVYPIVYVDCLVVKVRENQRIMNKALYLALGIKMDGKKEVLEMWMSENEGAKFWLAVCTDLRNRGGKDCSIACADGPSGLPEAIEAVFPHTLVQLCMVHLVHNSLKYVNYKQRAEVARDLKTIYSAATAEEAEFQLEVFAEKWDKHSPVANLGERTGRVLSRCSPRPVEIRRVIYTTNAIESLNASLRSVTSTHRIFPSDEAAYKVVYLALQNIMKKWTMPIHNWKAALNYFSIAFAERFPQ